LHQSCVILELRVDQFDVLLVLSHEVPVAGERAPDPACELGYGLGVELELAGVVQLLRLEEQGKGEVVAALPFLVRNSIDLANILKKDASLFVELFAHGWQLHMVLLEISF